MSLETELKRRLDVSDQPLAKRLRLAENILSSSYFPVLNKDEIILKWIFSQIQNTTDLIERNNYFQTLKNSLKKPIQYKNFTSNFKIDIFNVLSGFLKLQGTEKDVVIECCLNYLENPAVISHLQQCVDEYFTFQTLLLTTILEKVTTKEETNIKEKKDYEMLAKRSLNDISNFTKNFGKKAILVESFIDCKTLNIVLEFSNDPRFNYKALNICQFILFPKSTIQIYRSYLGALIKGTSITSLIEEKGESLRTIVKVMDVLFRFFNDNDDGYNYLSNFVRLFTFCCKGDEMVIFFFTILLTHCVGVEQDYIQIHGSVSKIELTKKNVQKIYLKIIQLLSEHNVNLNITFSNEAKSENDKNFITFLQQATLNILKEKKLTLESLLIAKSIILLDPSIFEPLISKILPNMCVQSKNETLMPTYNSMMLTILNVQFKLSRGTEFLPKFMPYLKTEFESIDNEQCEYIAKCKDADNTKYLRKIITHENIFTMDFCLSFGKLGSELMSWQNVNILNSLSDMLNTFCFKNVTDEKIAPSVVTMTELICSLLNSFFFHTKMADQSLTQNVVKKFVDELEHFEAKTLGKLGRLGTSTHECRLIHSFLDLCFMYGQFKLLLCEYQPYYSCAFVGEDGALSSEKKIKKIGDISILHDYLSSSEWKDVFNVVKNLEDGKCKDAMNRLILQKLTTLQLCKDDEITNKLRNFVRTYAFENIDCFWNIIVENDLNGRILLANLNVEETKLFTNKIVHKFLNNDCSKVKNHVMIDFMNKESIKSDKNILSEMVVESSRLLWEIFEKQKNMNTYDSLVEMSQSSDFEIKIFLNEKVLNLNDYMEKLTDGKILKKSDTLEKIVNIIEFMSLIPVQYLKEKYQHMVLFNIVTIKLMISKQTNDIELFEKLGSKIESMMFKIFELSYKAPNILAVFSFQFIVENNILQLTNVENKKYNSHYKILKLMYERLINKEYVHGFKNVLKYFKKELTVLDSKSSEEKLNSSVFQMSSVLYVCLTNFKKVDLPSEVKTLVVKAMNDAKEIVLNVFESLKWKSLTKDVGNVSDLERSQVDVNMSTTSIEDKTISNDSDDLNIAKANLMECYSLILQNKLDSKEEADLKTLKNFKKGLKLFVNCARDILSNMEICLHHAKGSSALLNVILKRMDKFEGDKILQDRETFFTDIFTGLFCYIQNNNQRLGGQWVDVSNINLDNTKLIFELSDDKTFTNLVTKYCSGNFSIQNTTNDSSAANIINVTKILWTCLMSASLKTNNKSEARLNILKEICGSFRKLSHSANEKEMRDTTDAKDSKDEDEKNAEKNDSNNDNANFKEDIEKMGVCFQVACQFVSSKKIPLSSVLIDSIIQMPLLLSMDSDDDQMSMDVFSEKFEMCSNLVNALLIHRSELLQDRWPCFLQAYRKILKHLCLRSHTDKIIDAHDVEKLRSMAITMERITQSMVKNEKQELSRISSYLIADIINCNQKVPVLPEVKFHIEKCVYSLFELLDTHSIGFLMRNMQDSQRLIFQQIHQSYNRYYKYTGTS